MLSGRKTYLLLANKKMTANHFQEMKDLATLSTPWPPQQAPGGHLPSAGRPALVLSTAHMGQKIGTCFVLSFSLMMLGWQGGISLPSPFFANAAHAAMPCTTRAETCLVKAPLALPFSLHFHVWLLGTDGRRAEMHRCRNTYGFSHFLPCHLRKSEI